MDSLADDNIGSSSVVVSIDSKTNSRIKDPLPEKPENLPLAGSKLKFALLPSKFRESGLKAPSSKIQDTRSGKVIQRNYVLNDSEAIKKKIQAERRVKDMTSKEAKDGSNVNIALKASLFEVIKSVFSRIFRKIPTLWELRMWKV